MISQTAEYALRAIVFLAMANGTPRTRKQISSGSHVPLEYLTKVMQILSDQGIVSIKRTVFTLLAVITATIILQRVAYCKVHIPKINKWFFTI